MTPEPVWLDEDEQRLWRLWLSMGLEVNAALSRELAAESDLSLQDYSVLVQLSEAEDHRGRISAVARALDWERSRLSHHLGRMERRGLVSRTPDPDDGRGALAQATPAGLAAITAAAPGHVAQVRRVLFDVLDADERAALERIARRVIDAAQQATCPAEQGVPAAVEAGGSS